MLVVNSIFVVYYFVFGFCIGGWASIKTLVDKISVLGIFVDCYQVNTPSLTCSTPIIF